MEEQELIYKIQNGDHHLFSKLIDLHKNMVYALVYRMIDYKEEAEEVAQDVFIKAFKAIKQFKGQSKFSTWLYKIAYFTAINHLRKHKRLKAPIDMSTFSSSDKSALDMLNEEDSKQLINEALKYVKPIERTLISLFYLEEFSNKEIEEITGLSQSNIKVTLLRTRKKLYGIIQKIMSNEVETILKH